MDTISLTANEDIKIIKNSLIEFHRVEAPINSQSFPSFQKTFPYRFAVAINEEGYGWWEFLWCSRKTDWNVLEIDNFDWKEIAEYLPEVIEKLKEFSCKLEHPNSIGDTISYVNERYEEFLKQENKNE